MLTVRPKFSFLRSHPVFSALLALLVVFSGGQARAQNTATLWDDEAEPLTNISGTLEKGASGNFRLAFDYQDAKNFYVFDATPHGASFSVVQNGKPMILATVALIWKPRSTVVLQRRPYLMQLIVDDQVVLRAFDAKFRAGKIGVFPTTWKWNQPRVQPLENLVFDDDFTREGSDGDADWKASSGAWKLSAASIKIDARTAAMSSNPFAYEVTPNKGMALVSAGNWFWDSYDARVAVKPDSAGQIGIASYVKDPKNYLAFVWSSANGPEARRLIQVKNGKQTVLARAAGNFLPRQWYQIGVRNSPGYIEAIVDGVPVLRAPTEAFGQGGIALLANGVTKAAFDDVKVRSYDFLRADFASNGAWRPVSGQWKLAGGFANSAPAVAGKSGERFLLTGAPDWDGYRVFVSGRPQDKQGIGFITGWRDSKNYTLFRIANGRQSIIRVQNGQQKVLSDAPAGWVNELSADSFARFQITAQKGVYSVESNDQILAQVIDKDSTRGQFGLWATGTNTQTFKDAVVFFPPAPEPIKVAPRMENDAYMVGWASPTGEWPPDAGPKGLEFWNTGQFFGDTTVSFPWRAFTKGSVEVALRAKRGEFESGYVLKGEASDDRTTLTWTLLRDGKTLQTATSPGAASDDADESKSELQVQVDLNSNQLLLSTQLGPILSYLDPSPPTGSAIAVRTLGFRLRAERLHALSTQRDDYTFTEAPIDFYAPSGDWHVVSRWPCLGDWSFFGGKGRNPVLWSKRTYGGDMVVEMYAHPQMELPKEPGYPHPGDLNMTLGGDGLNLGSGYSFVVAGRSNTRSQILRGAEVVAERSDGNAVFVNTQNRYEGWHRKWFYLRAEARHEQKDGKDGVRLSMWIDENKVLEYFDPQPLPGLQKSGRVAFWTLDSTITIARAKIEAQRMGNLSLPASLIDSQASAAPVGDGFSPRPVQEYGLNTAVVAKEGGGWKITNPSSGGLFGVDWNSAPVKMTPNSRWNMEATIPPGTKIDLYLQTGDDWHLVELDGDQKPDAMAPSLGKANKIGVVSGLTRYSFDVGAALAREFPGQKEWSVDKVRLGAMHGDPYRWQGFDGNLMGASYNVGSMKIE